MPSHDPHADQPVLHAGAPLADAAAAAILVHGRGATADGMLQLARALDVDDVAFLAPQAAGGTWYPLGFMAPIERNEPWLSSALRLLGDVAARTAGAGIPPSRTLLLGFSQGACLTSEFVAREGRAWGGVAILTGGLIGPDGTPRDYSGDLTDTPVLLASGDPDPHVPVERVYETGRVLTGMGAVVDERIYPGLGHTISREALDLTRGMIERLGGA